MVYTNAHTVDMDRATTEEVCFMKRIMKVQYEGEKGIILYDPIYQDKLYLTREKIALRGEMEA